MGPQVSRTAAAAECWLFVRRGGERRNGSDVDALLSLCEWIFRKLTVDRRDASRDDVNAHIHTYVHG